MQCMMLGAVVMVVIGGDGGGGRGKVQLELVEVVVVVVQEHAKLGLTCHTRPPSKRLGLDYVSRHCLRDMSMSCLFGRFADVSFRDIAS